MAASAYFASYQASCFCYLSLDLGKTVNDLHDSISVKIIAVYFESHLTISLDFEKRDLDSLISLVADSTLAKANCST